MTTAYTDTTWFHNSDAAYQAWVTEFHNLITAAGLVQTSDTGQIANLATITRPGVNALTGYRVYRFDDALQATAPIIIKIWFGTGGTTTNVRVEFQVGIATDGAGNFTGGRTTTLVQLNDATHINTGTNYVSRACHVPGAFWIAFKINGSAGAHMSFGVSRSYDSSGSPSGLGYTMFYCNKSTFAFMAQQVIFSSNTLSSASGTMNCLIPNGTVSSVVGTDVQFWKHYMATPRMRCLVPIMTTNIVDTPRHTERSLTPVGATAHNYVSVGFGMGHSAGQNSGTNNTVMLIWE